MAEPAFEQMVFSELRYIREQLEKANDLIIHHREDHFELKQDLNGLKIKSGIIGSLSGMFAAILHKLIT